VQARLREEIRQGLTGTEGVAADCIELPLAEMVVHESLRLYPPNWALITRRCIRESTIGDYRIPKGSALYIFPYVIHRDARWFTAPDSFEPDRFAPENFGSVQSSAYMPLGLGPHVCIGNALSTIILTSMLARILQEFRVELAPHQEDIEPEVGIVIRPKHGLQVVVTRCDIA
jgi:cytochrome P450